MKFDRKNLHNPFLYQNRGRAIAFLCFWVAATFTSAIFADPVNEATFAPVFVFCPWIRIPFETSLVYESKFLVAGVTTIYFLILYLTGTFSKRATYILVLCLHCIGAYLAVASISIGELDEDLMVWGCVTSIATWIFYYCFDLLLLKTSIKQKAI
jgi:hypothetical protein